MPFKIPINTEQSYFVEGHTEITVAFQKFVKEYPEAKRFELKFQPAPWNNLHAQPFKHIPNEWIEYLNKVWSKQLNQFLSESELRRIPA